MVSQQGESGEQGKPHRLTPFFIFMEEIMSIELVRFFECSDPVNPFTIGIGIGASMLLAWLFERFYR